MTSRTYITTLICLYSCFIFHVISADQACDESKCKGPIAYYKDLGCIPTYSSEDSCCPVRYNCDHLYGRAADKCYYKGRAYGIGERLSEEDAKPCDIGCTCTPGYNDVPHFSCAVVDCFNKPEPGCYLKKGHNQCCDGPQVCTREGTEGIAKCEVDGKTYLDGQRFTPSSDPTLSCICSEGYTGENVAPFCKLPQPYTCDTELRHAHDVYHNCTPAFYSTQNPATDCNFFSRCQNKDDRVVESAVNSTETKVAPVSDTDSTCIFGQLTMKIGDQLNQGTYYSSVCLKCVCEIPPIPTCQRLLDSECDITVHAQFEEFSK